MSICPSVRPFVRPSVFPSNRKTNINFYIVRPTNHHLYHQSQPIDHSKMKTKKQKTKTPKNRTVFRVHKLAEHRDYVPRINVAAVRETRSAEAATQTAHRQRYCVRGVLGSWQHPIQSGVHKKPFFAYIHIGKAFGIGVPNPNDIWHATGTCIGPYQTETNAVRGFGGDERRSWRL